MMESVNVKDLQEETSLYILKKAHLIITVVFMLFSQVTMVVGAYYTLKSDIRSNFEKIDNHIDRSPQIHLDYKSISDGFVPRQEYKDLKELIVELKSEVKELRLELIKKR